jgi:hypothetical protein
MAIKANITIDQGTDFSTTISVTDEDGVAVDLSGYTGAAQLRKWYTSTNSTSFDVTLSDSSVSLGLSSSITTNLAAGRYVYDVELTDTSANTISRILEGIVTVTPNVTR